MAPIGNGRLPYDNPGCRASVSWCDPLGPPLYEREKESGALPRLRLGPYPPAMRHQAIRKPRCDAPLGLALLHIRQGMPGDRGQIYGLALQRCAGDARQTQEIFDQLAHAVRGTEHAVEILPPLIVEPVGVIAL